MHFNQQPKLRLSMIALACQLACLAGTASAQVTDSTTVPPEDPKKTVVIVGKKIGMGLMVTEDAPKARSTITAEELEKQRPTGNAYEALEMLPSVNSYNNDATGLFGGGLTLRGFNSDQIGATINGVPVNDSGNFAVYPQEYVDQENTCSEFVTQGSTDVDSPQVGASGGNFGIVTCNPENASRVRVMQTLGQLNMYKTFVRYDTGLWADKRSKMFVSVSNAKADKWKGQGEAKRQHLDAGFNYDWDRFNYVHATLLWNEAHNNSINNLTLDELNKNGYYYDTSSTFAGHLTPVKGTAQNEVLNTPPYYGLYLNPFKNAIFSATAKFRLADNTDLKIVPYYWYGFGNGGIQQKAVKEAGSFLPYDTASKKMTGSVDLNGDGDTLDTVIMANASVTRTNRPGLSVSLTHTIGEHVLLGGLWYERASHKQTGEMVPVTAKGDPVDDYLQNQKVIGPTGAAYESRNSKTISTAYQAFLQDTFSVGEKAMFNVGLRTPYVKRDVTNYANEGAAAYGTFNIERTYHTLLPQLGARYRLTADDQLFASVARNMRAPANYVFTNTGSNVQLVGGVPTLMKDVQAETSYNTDIGYRHQDSKYIATLTVFDVNFKNRQGNAYDPFTGANTYTNIGSVRNRGFEIEANNMPIHGWSFYGSIGYQKSEIKNDIVVGSTAANSGTLATNGKEMINTPRWKGGLSAEYQDGAFWVRAKAKATSKQMASLMNDEVAPGYTTFGIDGGYTFADLGLLKRPKLTFNISNITNKQYRNPSSTSSTNALKYPGVSSVSTIRYYLGAPRFASATLSVDF
ncbi:TonB-dependent receptor [Massilia agilis]|uniref:TonB-dependent receptor n=1 Tax=Massilia agilis TaxID=1811226 RepID=A0ABT2DI32_9BURK|nr:TonB-dependent receptor [Massilia agilis]MCS0810123.1 TonB-dependent receptor [Massilia agilis]